MEEKFRVTPKLEYIKSTAFLIKFKNWDDSTKKDFIKNLGGKVNFKQTQEFLNTL